MSPRETIYCLEEEGSLDAATLEILDDKGVLPG
jgi:hypothetical protein